MYGTLSNSAGFTAYGMPGTSTVWPSAVARATTPVAVLPPAPGRFSITTGFPRLAESSGPSVRAITSFGPPGG